MEKTKTKKKYCKKFPTQVAIYKVLLPMLFVKNRLYVTADYFPMFLTCTPFPLSQNCLPVEIQNFG